MRKRAMFPMSLIVVISLAYMIVSRYISIPLWITILAIVIQVLLLFIQFRKRHKDSN